MNPKVSIIMGSTSDLPVMEGAAKILNDFEIPFEMNALSAHRTPDEVERFAKGAYGRGVKVIIAAAGMAKQRNCRDNWPAYTGSHQSSLPAFGLRYRWQAGI